MTDLTKEQACAVVLDSMADCYRARMNQRGSLFDTTRALTRDILGILDGAGDLPRLQLVALVPDEDRDFYKEQGEPWFPEVDLGGELVRRWDELVAEGWGNLSQVDEARELTREEAIDQLLGALADNAAYCQSGGCSMDVMVHSLLAHLSGSTLNTTGFTVTAVAGSNFPTGDEGDMGGDLRWRWAQHEHKAS